ncbi:LysR substrate-binding domain-containing protein [Chitinasiproducens palmae]|uniref:DNA-binding transcriptional regulator, LysR family n=1 Tax=Chitinasiproducens palmae TaxID=1770053 RepID=A0A1H2PRX0_9BURK|nr:LysR substrate-binding domain-containing protein [Chitinasiproducens palmae]SDV49680.1 DNA-binding transcriptional regulator, LysR family [Chitinasiproducens palmae]
MTLDQLRVFVAVADRGHLTRAADALALTPAAVSAAIRALERRYDVQLFDRVGRGIVLTAPGAAFLEQARATLANAQATELALQEMSGTGRGRVRVHASQTIASYWLPQRLIAFRQRYPALELALTIGNTSGVAQGVNEGGADLGLVEGDVDGASLDVTQVATDRLFVVVAPSHAWADGRRLGTADLVRSSWISRESGSGTRSVFEAALRAGGVDAATLDVVLTLPSNEAVRVAVEHSACAAVLSERVAAPAIEAGRLVRAGFALPPRSFNLLRHRERYRTRAAEALVALLVD